MTDLSSFTSGSADRSGPAGPNGPSPSGQPEQPYRAEQDEQHGQNEQSGVTGDAGRTDRDDRTGESEQTSGTADPNGSSASDQASESIELPEFVNEPVVPLRLRLPGTVRHTLYHPGWYAIEEGQESQAFLGVPGEVLYGFEKLTHLVDYMRTGVPTGLAPGPDLAAVRSWTAEEYASRLCDYGMVAIPELANGELSSDEQGSVGSMLAVGLDMMDFLRIEGEHADELRQDEDVSKLAAGDEVLSIFAAGRHRHHVVEMIETHWGPCMAAIAARTTDPRSEA